MRSETAKVVGTPTKTAWSQVHSFLPQDEAKLKLRGQLVAVLAISNLVPQEGVNAVALGREALNRLNEEYFGRSEGSTFLALKRAVGQVGTEFANLGRLQIQAAVLWQDFIYFGLWGGGKVVLWRGGKLASILAAGSGQVASLSGTGHASDLFLLGSDEFFAALTPDILTRLLRQSQTAAELAENITPLAHRGSLPAVAAAILKVGETGLAPKTETKRDFFKNLKDKSQNFLLSLARRLPQAPPAIKKAGEGRLRRTSISVGLVLLLLLVASIGFGTRLKNQRSYRATYEARLVRAQELYQDALLQAQVSRPAARESFRQAKNLVTELQSQGIKDKDLEVLAAKIKEDEVELLGKIEAEPQTFLDLSLVRSGVLGQELVFHEGVLAVLDSGGQRLISLRVADKKTDVLGGEESLGRPTDMALYAGRFFALSEKGVLELSARKLAKVVVKPDPDWGEIFDLSAFGGNLYLLDKRGAIFRYPATSAGFAARQNWLGQGVAPDFANAQDAAIDGSIWVLAADDKISKFTRGAPDVFRVSGLDGTILGPTALYTDENLESIFILDTAGKRIVEVSKNGEYQKQYLWPGAGEVRDLVVDREAGKIFLLTQDKILEIPLK